MFKSSFVKCTNAGQISLDFHRHNFAFSILFYESVIACPSFNRKSRVTNKIVEASCYSLNQYGCYILLYHDSQCGQIYLTLVVKSRTLTRYTDG